MSGLRAEPGVRVREVRFCGRTMRLEGDGWLDAGGRFDAGSFYAEAEALLADRDRLIDEARD